MTDDGRRALLEGLSHELRAPLQTLLGHVDLLGSGAYGELNPEQSTAVASVQRSAERILGIANDVLQIARIEAGNDEVTLDDVAIDELLAREIDDAREAADKKGLRLTLECPKGLTVRTDGRKLARIVANLIGNAVKYTVEGGVTVRALDKTIEVADTGPGIPPDKHDVIFQAYVRLDRTQPGTGLGLAIVSGLAAVLGARVSVGSAPGGGTTIRVELA